MRNIELGKQFKKACIDADITAADIHKGTGISKPTITKIMRGEMSVSFANYNEVANFLGKRIKWVFEDK